MSASKQERERGTEVSYLRVRTGGGRPNSLPRRRSRPLFPPLPSHFPPQRARVLVGVIPRAALRRIAARARRLSVCCLPASLSEGERERALPRRSARFSFNSRSVEVGLDSSDLSLPLSVFSVCEDSPVRSFVRPLVFVCVRSARMTRQTFYRRRSSRLSSGCETCASFANGW